MQKSHLAISNKGFFVGSTIRSTRDQRFNVRTSGERRETTYGGDLQKTYDEKFTAHSSNRTPHAFISEPSDTDTTVDHVHEIIRDQLAPRIQTKSANAVLGDRREFLYYRRKRNGRRCSCYETETSPDNQCAVCIGTGIVGGYEKNGTIAEVLDYTTPNLVMVNVEPNFDEDTRPVYLRLNENAKKGYVEGTLPIKNNIGLMENFFLYQPIFNRGTRIVATDPNGYSKEIKEKEDFIPFLKFSSVRVRIEFTKMDDKPIISHFLFRYQIKESMIIWGDIPRSEEQYASIETGAYEAYQEITIFFPYRPVVKFRNEDVLYRCSDGRMFKTVLVNENVVANVLTSTDVRARYLISDIDVGITRHLLI
jgi:hypothetical protein